MLNSQLCTVISLVIISNNTLHFFLQIDMQDKLHNAPDSGLPTYHQKHTDIPEKHGEVK